MRYCRSIVFSWALITAAVVLAAGRESNPEATKWVTSPLILESVVALGFTVRRLATLIGINMRLEGLEDLQKEQATK